MSYKKTFILIIVLLLSFSCKRKEEKPEPQKQVIKTSFGPVVAGQFYPDDPAQLKAMVKEFIENAKVEPFSENLLGVIAPHAGYIYSGPVAGYAFKAIGMSGKKKFVIIAPSHHISAPDTAAVLDASVYKTPLGEVKINQDKVKELLNEGSFIKNAPVMFEREHSMEVMLPFLQVALGDEFEIVPIVMGQDGIALAEELAEALLKVFPESEWAFIASTDLSHFHTDEEAKKLDEHTLELVMEIKTEQLDRELFLREAELCGREPVLTMLKLFEKKGAKFINRTGWITTAENGRILLLDKKNSFDTTGQRPGNVVGYASLAFLIKSQSAQSKLQLTGQGEPKLLPPTNYSLTLEEKRELVRIAKLAVETYVSEDRVPEIDTKFPKLKEMGAAFVTLKINGALRGCIGHIIPREPLYLCVRDVATSAAKHDMRFPPVTKEELPLLEYEISVLTPLERVNDLNSIVVGRDGLIMKYGFYQGVLLPQVPIEQGWDRETFLSHTCRKAGMDMDCWHNPSVEINKFQALVFSEEELK